ncbi:MAG: FadR/GntR family transcriptional regulator [Winogradskyella sp.]|uniref:FadR/GntR family transcriptional regulator n=1 Tax=Winogradskyella sp. TaxID=1883156 RepID=UPI00385F1E37
MFNSIVSNKSLSEQVENKLTEAIRAGKYLPGHQIPTEHELCDMFNVSRTSIREAVKKMSARGIVEVKRGKGVFVSEMSIKNTSEILNLFFELSSDKSIISQTIKTRLIIEPVLAAEAAIYRTDSHIALLKNNMDEMKKCALADKKKEADIDNDFHKTLLSIVDNKVLDLLLKPIFNLTPKFKNAVYTKSLTGELLRDKTIMIDHHNNILEAIIAQDAHKAAEAMRAHIIETQKIHTQSLQ